MKTKTILATLASTAIIASTLPIAYAGTTQTPQMTKSKIVLNGSTYSEPYKFVGGSPATTYMPIYYVQQLINKALGIASSNDVWNGNNHTWSLNVSGKTPKVLSHGSGSAVVVNGTTIEDAPTMAAVDPSSGKPTTFMPIWYVQQLLNQVLGLNSTTDVWDGSTSTPTWTITTQASATSTGSGTSTTTTTGTSTLSTAQKAALMQEKAKNVYGDIAWKVEGNYRVFTAPLFLDTGYWELVAQSTGTIQYSLDNGKTWNTPHADYDSWDNTQGGISSLPSGVTHVLVRANKSQLVAFQLNRIGHTLSAGIGYFRIYSNGTTKESLQVIGTYN